MHHCASQTLGAAQGLRGLMGSYQLRRYDRRKFHVTKGYSEFFGALVSCGSQDRFIPGTLRGFAMANEDDHGGHLVRGYSGTHKVLTISGLSHDACAVQGTPAYNLTSRSPYD